MRRVVFLGGNGHCAARLAPARAALEALVDAREVPRLDLVEVPYPGFEGRPRAGGLEEFLRAVSDHLDAAASEDGATLYATGIGGLIALCLRARGELLAVPLLLQAPVLWGIERRLMPRLMRNALAPKAVRLVFASSAFRTWFGRRYFVRPPSTETIAAFFDGYARCPALADLFAWLTPALLESLRVILAERPAALENVRVWWGGRDRVVTPRELAWTRDALGVDWPLRVFPAWGHYPMLDEPEAWVRELAGSREAQG